MDNKNYKTKEQEEILEGWKKYLKKDYKPVELTEIEKEILQGRRPRYIFPEGRVH